MADTINLDEYLKKDQVGVFFIETQDSRLLEILEEEKIKAGLDGAEIHLMLPETPREADTNKDLLAHVARVRNNDYNINLYPLAMKRWGRSARWAIRHEIAHIKYDLGRKKLPGCLEKIYSLLISEPRANWYAEGY